MKKSSMKQLVETEMFIAEDGQEFYNEKECLKYESCTRGKVRVKCENFHDETRYYFKAVNEQIWRDCLTYLGDHLYTDFLHFNKFEDFIGKWCFTEYDVQGEFYRLYTRDALIAQYHEDINEIENDLILISHLDEIE